MITIRGKKIFFHFGPALLACVLAAFYIFSIPGKIANDAAGYDALADSIRTVGRYELDGAPSMLREPGYPMFRVMIKTFSPSLNVMMWIQALLYIASVMLIGSAIRRMDPRYGEIGAWAAACSYALAFYPSQHSLETVASFLLALIGWIFARALNQPRRVLWWIVLGVASVALVYTRFNFLLVPVAIIMALSWVGWKDGIRIRNIMYRVLLMGSLILVLIAPWFVRNHSIFGEWNMAGRSDVVLYARAWKASQPWQSLGWSYVSVFLGRGMVNSLVPSNTSIYMEQWTDKWENNVMVARMSTANSEAEYQRIGRLARRLLFSRYEILLRYAIWSGVDGLRMLAFPNPMPQSLGASIEGTWGVVGKEGRLSFAQWLVLAVSHMIQFLWFGAIAVSTWIGFRRYGLKYVPGIIFLAIFLPHLGADNVARYGVPLHPWLLAGIAIVFVPTRFLFSSRPLSPQHDADGF